MPSCFLGALPQENVVINYQIQMPHLLFRNRNSKQKGFLATYSATKVAPLLWRLLDFKFRVQKTVQCSLFDFYKFLNKYFFPTIQIHLKFQVVQKLLIIVI